MSVASSVHDRPGPEQWIGVKVGDEQGAVQGFRLWGGGLQRDGDHLVSLTVRHRHHDEEDADGGEGEQGEDGVGDPAKHCTSGCGSLPGGAPGVERAIAALLSRGMRHVDAKAM